VKRFAELPRWIFELKEVSMGVYEVVARDDVGHCVKRIGIDPDKLILECKQEAMGASSAAR
jgi:hypothetical protein